MTAPDVAAVLAESPWAGRPGLQWRPGIAAVASPMCQAVDWSTWIVTCDNTHDAIFLKIVQPDMHGFIDPAAMHAGASAGAAAGVAPAVAFFLPQHCAIGFSYMPPPWRAARLDDLRRPDILARVIAAQHAIQLGPALSRAWDVFARVGEYAMQAERSFTALPADMPALLQSVQTVRIALDAAGHDSRPCHNDAQASNVLLNPDGQVQLVDFDRAGQADPHYDLGVLLNEAHDSDDGWRLGIEMAHGRVDERVLNRCRVYAMADDLMCGLWGLILSATSPRRGLEFLKFGEWRLLRCRMALRAPSWADRLHRL